MEYEIRRVSALVFNKDIYFTKGLFFRFGTLYKNKTKGVSFQMTTASSCCEGVARNQTAPHPIKYQLLRW